MRVVDLTHTISENMPVYPGTDQPVLAPANTYERNGFKETRLTMFSHTGTHMDPPAHVIEGGATLDSFPVDHFVGTAVVVDCRDLGFGGRATLEHVARCPHADKADFLLFDFGWSAYWGMPEYFGDYPCIGEDVVDYILGTGKRGVGLDTIGLDPIADEALSLHHRLLSCDTAVIMENLANLDCLIDKGLFTLCALPLRIEDADGSPLRAVALIDA